MSQIEQLVDKKIVYTVLYNYHDCDYSIIKIMTSINDAYNYICCQQKGDYDDKGIYQLIYISNCDEIDKKTKQEYTNICCIPHEKYHKIVLSEVCTTNYISPYIIVPMELD